MIRLRVLVSLLLIAASVIAAPRATWAAPMQAIRLPDGVVLWTPKEKPGNKPRFFSMLEDLAKIFLPGRAELPFDRSIAFLVGVSDYKNLKSLPFVKNDLHDMKDYLLQNGFDQVYVAAEEIVSSDLIESYMMNRFPDELGKRDRLLFYYAGHGADARGRTGYLQFTNARPGDFARSVLAVDRVLEWGRVNRAAHMLFLLDTCSSGLAFSPRGSWAESDARLIQTLSGWGSRSVVTAGTAAEETFEVKSGNGKGNGVFTRALLSVLQQGQSQGSTPSFLTIEQVVADLQVSVGKFVAENHKSLHPNLWTFDDAEYRGSFVFLNPAVRNSPIKESHLAQLRASPRGQLLLPPTTIQTDDAEKKNSQPETNGAVESIPDERSIKPEELRKIPFTATIDPPFAVRGKFFGDATIRQGGISVQVKEGSLSFPVPTRGEQTRHIESISAGVACDTKLEIVSESQRHSIDAVLLVGQTVAVNQFELLIPSASREISGCLLFFSLSDGTGYYFAYTKKGLFDM